MTRPCRGGEALIVGFAFPEERILVPQVSDEIAREAHFRQNEDIRAGVLRAADFLLDLLPVRPDLSRADIQLSGDDPNHDRSPLRCFLLL